MTTGKLLATALILVGLASAQTYKATVLPSMGASSVGARAVNDQGVVVGSASVGPEVAFIWSIKKGMKSLGSLGGGSSEAMAINNSGQVVGWSLTSDGSMHPFQWISGSGMQDLGTLGVAGALANGINNL